MKMRTRRAVCAMMTVLAWGAMVGVTAQEYTQRQELMQDEALRRDFTVQGEYLLSLGDPSEIMPKIGMHLIADGGGKFRVIGYLGGLPGDGWMPPALRLIGTATLEGDDLTCSITEIRGKTPDGGEVTMPEPLHVVGKVVIERPQSSAPGEGAERRRFRGVSVKLEFPPREDSPARTVEKVYRQSPTLGAKSPEGAVTIFDGTNVDKFELGAKMNESPRGNTLWAEATAKPFDQTRPYRLHLEFMLSYMPQAHGQARSNSGVYVGQMYECQVLDSFGLEGENNECGGFYQISKPLVNMCAPPLTWQTYDFDYTPPKFDGDKKTANARVTVRHNGVVIHDDIELPRETPGCMKEGAGPRGLYLQGHGNKVQYRNIWVEYQK